AIPVLKVRNPLPAQGGVDPETAAQIQRRAPQAFNNPPWLRAVIPSDYAAVTEQYTGVEQAAANFRWTGSWHTVFLTVDPVGGGSPPPALEQGIVQYVDSYRMAGYDLQVESPVYVSLEIDLTVCVDPNYFRSDVQQGLLQVLGNQQLPNGQTGFFYPDNFTFGQTVYLSGVYAAARTVTGVQTVQATLFGQQGVPDGGIYLHSGEMKLGSLQIARLYNDPNFPEYGILRLTLSGGK
ncbi:MAG TPA: baseplate J/gp47 family protein, partial [bacterium]|nr:baseplate J/gp47 family protein [bacterium]